ncbi:MAG TPA: S8 family serine peptidase, partial [Casimicrobiaceae bacterium]|nr:S8 family serine peptidase [Casimicrobiaceae bacterium]
MHDRFARHDDRAPQGVLRWLVAVALAVVSLAAIAATPIDTIVVRLRDDSASAGAATLATADRNALISSLRSTFSLVDRTREGAYVLQFTTPLALDAARAAVNRARLLPQVLYANFEDPGGTAADPALARATFARHPPVTRMIVKYRDAALVAGALHNLPLPAANLDQLTTVAGQPIALERAMSGGAYVVRLFQALPVDQAASLASQLESDQTIDYAVPDLVKQPLRVPNDPLYSSQWNYMSPPGEMGGANLPPAWDRTTGAANIVIAVIDTGSLPGHPDLAGRYVGGYDFIANVLVANDGDARDADPSDPGDWITSAESASGFFAGCPVQNSSFHGTHVAGTIGAASNNATGVAGINWVSRILPVRVLGKCGGFTSDIVDAIRWAVGIAVPGVPANPNPARVLNMSFGGYACDINGANCACDAASQSAIDDAVAAGAIPVVAAGNSNRPAVESSPGDCN